MTVEIDGIKYGYIGKKAFYYNRKVPLAKKDLPTDKRKPKTKIRTSLNYQKYFSSNETIKKAVAEGKPVKRIILQLCYSARELTYYEVKYQFKCDVLESEAYLNDNILGKFYKYGANAFNKTIAKETDA